MSAFAGGLENAPIAYRDGDILVVPTGCTLPPNCIKCNTAVDGKFLKKTFRWHTPWLYALVFFGLILYIIVSLIVQKKSRIEIPLCPKHRSWRTKMHIIGSSLLVAWIPVLLLLNSLDVDGGTTALMCIAIAFSGFVVLGIVGMSIAPIYIDEMRTELKGAGEEFLSSLPMKTRHGFM